NQVDFQFSSHYFLHSFNPTTDGGFMLGGNFQNGNQYDLFILKVDSLGNELWKKTYGGPFNDSKGYVNQTADGGLLICGYKVITPPVSAAAYVVKTNNVGNIEWEKEFVFSPNYPDILIKYIEVNDGYVFCGGHDD